MALQPSLRPLIIAGRADAPHTIDVFREQIFLFMSVLSGDRYLSVHPSPLC